MYLILNFAHCCGTGVATNEFERYSDLSVRDVGSLGCGIFGMWNISELMHLECGMFGMWNVQVWDG